MPRSQKAAVFVLIAAIYAYIIFNVLSPQNAWINPEVPHFDIYTVFGPGSTLAKTFNWEAYEFAPRVTRPLSNFVQIIEGWERYWLSYSVLPYFPSFSPTEFIIAMFLCPLLIFKILEVLGTSRLTCWLGFALALMMPTSLSHLGHYFRPAKALAELFFLIVVYLIAKYRERAMATRKRQLILFATLLLGLISDEWGVFAYGFILLYVLTNPRKLLRPFAPVLVAVPALTGVLDAVVFPWISQSFWDLKGGVQNYFIFDKFFGPDPMKAVLDQLELTYWLILDHLVSFSMETFGMYYNSPPEGPAWYWLMLERAVFVGALAYAMYVLLKRGTLERKKQIGFGLLVAFVAILLHSVMIGLTSMTFGPWYYAGHICIALVISYALLIDRIPAWLAIGTVALTSSTIAYGFQYTNLAMKNFHHYPRGNPAFQEMFRGELNRFTLQSPHFDDAKILLAMRDLKIGECTDVPNELVWYMTEIGYRWGTDFPYGTVGVRLCREDTSGKALK